VAVPHSSPKARTTAGTTVMGTLVVIYGMFDTLLMGVPIVLLAAWLNPLVVFAVAGIGVTAADGLCCTWLDREWDRWFAGSGRRIEPKLEHVRTSRLLRHPVAWIERGTDRQFALGAAITNAIIATVISRLLTGAPVGSRRILMASLAYGAFFTGLYTFVGFLLGGAISAV
jgi:hypothetical protein